MATIRQKKLAKAVVDNLSSPSPLNKQELVVSSGYSEITADRHATEILESKGVKEELKNFGFDSNKAKEVVAEILLAGENDIVKLKAADTIFKVNGDYAPEKHVNLNIIREENPKLDALIAQLEHELDNPEGTA